MTDDPTQFATLWNFGDPAGSEARFAALLPAAHSSSLRMQIETQIARAQGLQQRFDEAHQTLDKTEASLDGAPGVVRVRVLLERGRVFNSAGEPGRASPLFLEAFQIAESCGEDGLAVDAVHMLAIASDGDDAVAWNRKAISMAEASEQPAARKWLGSLTNNLGWDLHGAGRFEEALSLFEKALAHRIEMGAAEPTLIARWCVARCLRSLDRIDEALALQNALRQEREALEKPGGYVFEELGELHQILNNTEQAADCFAQAHALLSLDPWLVRNEPDRLARILALSSTPTG